MLHLLYARFWTKVMRDLGLVKFDEPFKKLLTQGMVLNHIYSRKTEKGGIEYFWPHEVENQYDDKGAITGALLKADGSHVDYGGVGTMSKSKNNGIDPQALIDQYGADTARLFTMFAAPPEQTLEWNDAGVEGAHRFLKRLWHVGFRINEDFRFSEGLQTDEIQGRNIRDLRREVHLILKQSSNDYQRMQYNTVVSAGMKMLNTIESFLSDIEKTQDGQNNSFWQEKSVVAREMFSILLRVLYPVVPHLTQVLWQQLGYATQLGELLDAPWPEVDPRALEQDEMTLVVQVNGKLRSQIQVPAQADRATIETAAVNDEKILAFLAGQPVKKIIVVPGKLVNLVVAS